MNDPFEDDPYDFSEPVAASNAQPTPAYPDPPHPAPTNVTPAHGPPPPPGQLQHAGFNCPACGYDLTGAVIGGQCPECGGHINPSVLTSNQSNAMAITSMVMGILALAVGFMTFGIATIALAPMGIIFGHVAGRQLRTGRYNSASKGYATTGLICSYVALLLVALVWGWFFLFVV